MTSLLDARVRDQYEQYPYPPRDPEDERTRLLPTSLETREVICHYCFGGEDRFADGANILVAGGGTGDATIYLAEQARDTPSRLYYADVSRASMAVAQARARVRGLENIEWIHGSMLDLPADLPPFDFVDCCGVLHHLDDPRAGLEALCGRLSPGGGMLLMVYGLHGRLGVYQMQSLARLLSAPSESLESRVGLMREVVGVLPETNLFRRSAATHGDHQWGDGSGIVDLFLHARDQAYDVDGLFALLDSCGVHCLQFAPGLRHLYDPGTFVPAGPLLDRIRTLSPRKQMGVAELLCGAIHQHAFLASLSENPVADLSSSDMVPMIPPLLGNPNMFHGQGGAWRFSASGLRTLVVDPGKKARLAFAMIDGRRTLGEIYQEVATIMAGTSESAVRDEFEPVFREMCEWSDIPVLQTRRDYGREQGRRDKGRSTA